MSCKFPQNSCKAPKISGNWKVCYSSIKVNKNGKTIKENNSYTCTIKQDNLFIEFTNLDGSTEIGMLYYQDNSWRFTTSINGAKKGAFGNFKLCNNNKKMFGTYVESGVYDEPLVCIKEWIKLN